MALKIANNATSRLAGAINNSQTTLTITPGTGIKFPVLSPGDWHPLTVLKADGTLEIMRVTARSADTLNVVRGQEGTSAIAFSANDRVELRITKALLDVYEAAAAAAQLAADNAQTSANTAQSSANAAQADVTLLRLQTQDGALTRIGSIAGTANAITGTVPAPFDSYENGQKFDFIAASDNTGPVTINLNGLGAKSITKLGATALRAGDIIAGSVVQVAYDGTRFQIVSGASGGGATGGGSDKVFYENGQTVTTDYTITSGKSAMSAGPVTINSGITVTIPSGSRWVIL